jgi:hypothetical protein
MEREIALGEGFSGYTATRQNHLGLARTHF